MQVNNCGETSNFCDNLYPFSLFSPSANDTSYKIMFVLMLFELVIRKVFFILAFYKFYDFLEEVYLLPFFHLFPALHFPRI